MHRILATLAVLALLYFSQAPAALSQAPEARSRGAVSRASIAKPFELYASYWTSEPGWDTELQLKNNLALAPLTVTAILRLASGRKSPLPR